MYMQVSMGGCTLHLSEHHGDVCPGASIRIETDELDAYHAQLMAANYKYARPGIEQTPWDSREVRIADPFGNRLVFVGI